ncbi:hypothetical protein PR048_007330, partial [Dryococelus australis]
MFSYEYTILKEGKATRVCKKFLLSTLCTSNGPLKTAFSHKSEASGTFVGTYQRGHKTLPNKTSEWWAEKIKAHVELFVTMEGHYCRKDTTKKKMYELFQKLNESEVSPLPSEGVYRNRFYTKYNIDFFTPSKYKCLICNKGEDKKRSNIDKTFMRASFDLQKVLQIPLLYARI